MENIYNIKFNRLNKLTQVVNWIPSRFPKRVE